MRLSLRWVVAVAFLGVVATCNETPVTLPQPSTVAVVPSSLSMFAGEVAEVAAQVLDQDGQVLESVAPDWSSSNTAVARVSPTGTVAAVTAGTATLTAAYGNISSTVAVTVTNAARVDVRPGSVQLLRSASQTVTAVVLGPGGEPLTALVTWRSLNPGIATVGSSGVTQTIESQALGSTSVIAEALGRADTVPVAVVQDSSQLVARVDVTPGSVQLYVTAPPQSVTAVRLNAQGERLTTLTTWRSLNPGIATVGSSGETQYVEPQAQGSTSVIAEASGRADTVPVVVVVDARELITSIRILPDTQPYTEVTVDGASPAPLEIEYRMQDGYGMERCVDYDHFELAFRFNRSVINSVSQVQNGSCRLLITPTGMPGSGWLYSSINTVTDSLMVTVNRIGYIARFSVLPADSTILAGETVQYTVEVMNEANVPAAGVAVNFNVTGGELSSRSVTTGAAGTAVVSWILPSRAASGLPIPYTGYQRAISFALEYPSGATSGLYTELAQVMPNVATRLVLLGNFEVGALAAPPSPAVDTLGDSVSINLATNTLSYLFNRNRYLFAQSFDRFGNPRRTEAVFRATDASIMSEPGQSQSQSSVWLYGDRLRTETVTATDGTASATLAVTWNVGPRIVFQTTGSSVVRTGQPYPRTTATNLLGDTIVFDGAGTAYYPTFTRDSATLAFGWFHDSHYDVGLVASDGSNHTTPTSAISAEYRSRSIWGFPAFLPGTGAGDVLFLSDSGPYYKTTVPGLSALGEWIGAFQNATNSGYVRAFWSNGASVTAVGGTATFSVNMSSYIANGAIVRVGAAQYTVSAFTGTNQCTLSGSPTFAASAFSFTVGSFLVDGFEVGGGVTASNLFTLGANRGPSVVTRVTADTLYVTKTGTMMNEGAHAEGHTIRTVKVWNLYQRTLSGGIVTQLTNTNVVDSALVLRGISLSPDGTKALLTSRDTLSRLSQVYEVTFATRALASVTANTDPNTSYYYAGYSPDGTKTYMDRYAQGIRELVEWNAVTGYRVLKTWLVGAAMPSFDPTDPTRLGFLNAATGELGFFTVPSGTTTRARQGLSYFSWSRR
jgi:hypothetical protein